MSNTAGMQYETVPVTSTKGLGKKVSTKAYRQAVENHSDLYTLWIIAYKRRVGILATLVVAMGIQQLVPGFYAMAGDAIQSLFGL